MHRRPYYASGHIALVIILRKWPYCTSTDSKIAKMAQVVIWLRWPYCSGGHIAQVLTLVQIEVDALGPAPLRPSLVQI